MKFLTLGINGFGVLTDVQLEDLGPGLNVIEGPNEAGKSTVLEFIRALLFGFETGLNSRKFLPVNGGQHGGWATVIDRENRRLRLERGPGRAAGTLTIELLGQSGGQSAELLLGGADRGLFANIFAFSLNELAGIDPLKADNVRGRIYAAGSGTGGKSIVTALPGLDKEMDKLFRSGARANPLPKINAVIGEIRELRQELNQLHEGLTRFNELSLRQEEIAAALEELKQQENAAIVAEQQNTAYAKAWPIWVSLSAAREQLAELPEFEVAALPLIPRFDELVQAEATLREQRETMEDRRRSLCDKHDQLVISESLLASEPELRALNENLKRCDDARQELPLLTAQAQARARAGAEALRELGPDWTEVELARLDVSVAQEQTVRDWRDRLMKAAADVEKAAERVTESREKLGRDQSAWQAGRDSLAQAYPQEPPPVPDFEARLAALKSADENLEKRAVALSDIRHGNDHIKGLNEEVGRLTKRTAEETEKRLGSAAEALAKAQAALMQAYPAAPEAVTDYAQKLDDLETCTGLLNDREKAVSAAKVASGRAEELEAERTARAASHEREMATRRRRAEGELEAAEQRLREEFPSPPEPIGDWTGCQQDLTEAALVLEKIQVLQIELRNLDQREQDARPVQQITPPRPNPYFWMLWILVAGLILATVFSDQKAIVAGLDVVLLVAVWLWSRRESRGGSSSDDAPAPTDFAPRRAQLSADLEALQAELAAVNARQNWTLADSQGVRELERRLHERTMASQRYQFLKGEVARAQERLDIIRGEIEESNAEFQKEDQALGRKLSAAQLEAAEAKGRAGTAEAGLFDIGRRHGWTIDDAITVANMKRQLRADNATWEGYSELKRRVDELTAVQEAVKKEVEEERGQARRETERMEQQRRERETEVQAAQGVARETAEAVRDIAEKFGWTLPDRAAVQDCRERTTRAWEVWGKFETARQEVTKLAAAVEAEAANFQQREQKFADANSARDELRQAWSRWLTERKLPKEATPETCLGLLGTARKAREHFAAGEEAMRTARELEKRIAQERATVERLCELLAETPPGPNEVAIWQRRKLEAAREELRKATERKALEGQLEELEAQFQGLGAKLRENEASQEDLFSSLGVSDEAEARQRAAIDEQRAVFTHQIRELEAQLELLSGRGEMRIQLESQLAELDPVGISVADERARADRKRIAEDIDLLRRELAENKVKLENLEGDDTLTRKRRELEAKETDLAELAREWAVLKLAHALLEKTRLKFERERQPGVVLRAGEILHTLTDGAYAAVIASEGLDSVELETPLGARKPLGTWSRGTSEQVYLALRFALIDDYCKVAEPLPIIMDDVLVHADGYRRLQQAAAAIGEVAQRHQVLYFTCRPGDADVLCGVNPEARRYRLSSGKFSRVEN